MRVLNLLARTSSGPPSSRGGMGRTTPWFLLATSARVQAVAWARAIFRADGWCSFWAITSSTGWTRVRQPARVASRDRLEHEAFSPTLEVEVRGRPTVARHARE